MELKRIVAALERIAPVGQAAPWDNVGLIVGDDRAQVHRILVANDATPKVIAEAHAAGTELLVSYHPPLLKGIVRLTPGAALYEAARANLAIFSPHTAWDAAPGGVNDVLAQAAGLVPTVCTPLSAGMGRVGARERPTKLAVLGTEVRLAMGMPFAMVAGGDPALALERVAVAAGAGDSFVEDVLASGAQVFVTGELRHHNLLALLAHGVSVLCLTHCGSERAALQVLAGRLADALGHNGPSIRLSDADVLPWRVV